MALSKRGGIWYYEFLFANQRIRESAKTRSKVVAQQAEQQRRRELERGFNGLTDTREERVRPVRALAAEYLEAYRLRHKAATFAVYALGHVERHIGHLMAIDVTEASVTAYQTARLKEDAAPKSVNEEVGFLLRVLGDFGDVIRVRMKRKKTLKLRVKNQVGKAFSPDEKTAMLAAAQAARSPAIYPALVLALNAGMRDAEIRHLQWGRVDFAKGYLTVGDSKTEAGEGRTIPLNSRLTQVLLDYRTWFEQRFGIIQPNWYVFAHGRPRPTDPTRPIVTLKTSWTNVRKKAKVTGRWHDARHTLVTDLAESGAGDETIRSIAGHVSPQMLKHYSHVRMKAKREALESIVPK